MSVKVVDVEKTYQLGENTVNALKRHKHPTAERRVRSLHRSIRFSKTTLLNLIGVLDKPTNGKIYINDTDLTRLKEKELTKLRRGTIGFIFQFL